MNGGGRKPLRCPCCQAGGFRPLKADPTAIVPQGRLKEVTVHRGGRAVRRWAVLVRCRCGWSWWSANPMALERAVKLERATLARRDRNGKRGLTAQQSGIILETTDGGVR